MDDSLRKVIFDNVDQLVEATDFRKLLSECGRRKILSEIMISNIEGYAYPSTDLAKHKMLWHKITKRGPTAYDDIIEICRELKFHAAVKILRPGEYSGQFPERKKKQSKEEEKPQRQVSTASTRNDGCIITKTQKELKLEIFSRETKHNVKVEVKKSKGIQSHEKIPHYPMHSKYRGVIFIVNIIEFAYGSEDVREGASHDGENLIHLFRELGFDVFYYENLKLKEFYDLLDELLYSQYVERTECFALALMTHGERKGYNQYVSFPDGIVENIDNILARFENAACKVLCGKPKVFLFPFCRGDHRDLGVHVEKPRRIETDGIHLNSQPNYSTLSDIHLCYGTVPGFRTFRDGDSGSWYVWVLCEVWAEHAHNTSLDDLQKLVGAKLKMKRISNYYFQTTSEEYWGVYKKLYFNPGYIQDSL